MTYEDDTTRYRKTACPTCGSNNDAATHVAGEHGAPQDGDLSICFSCATPMIFVSSPAGLGVRAPTAAEHAQLDADPEVIRVRSAITVFHGNGGSW